MLNTGDPGYSSKREDDGSWSIIDRETGTVADIGGCVLRRLDAGMAAGLVEDLIKPTRSEEVSTSQFIRTVMAEIEHDHFFACSSRNALSLAVFSSRAVFCKAIVIAAASSVSLARSSLFLRGDRGFCGRFIVSELAHAAGASMAGHRSDAANPATT